MNFFQQELHKILDKTGFDFVYIENSAYLSKGDLKFRIHFYNTFAVDDYDSLMLKVVNTKSADIDKIVIKFKDLIGKVKTNNPYFPDGRCLSIWRDNGGIFNWYVAKPTEEHYKMLADEVTKYVSVFAS